MNEENCKSKSPAEEIPVGLFNRDRALGINGD